MFRLVDRGFQTGFKTGLRVAQTGVGVSEVTLGPKKSQTGSQTGLR